MPPEKLFGTDGIRGISGEFPVNESGSRAIGFAVTKVLKKQANVPRIAVGRDTRKRGDLLQRKICTGIASCGGKIIRADICPTPAIVALVLESRADAGVMISASHNPPEYNGFKIFNSKGLKIGLSEESEIQKKFEKLKYDTPTDGLKTIPEEKPDWEKTYSSSLDTSAREGRDFSGMTICLDCANGAMFKIAPKVFEKTGAKMFLTGTEPDGKNINKDCGSLETSLLGKMVRESGAAFGAALDGDGDRVAFCDENGNEVDGDIIIALFAREMLENGALKKPLVATTVMSNKGLEIFLQKTGIEIVRTDVGDRNVSDIMRKELINFGGEKSGHLIFSDYSTNGDGLLAALLIADIVKKKNKPFSQILPQFELFPHILANLRVAQREPFDQMPGLTEEIPKLEQYLGNGGRIHMRYSGTEPLARILVEGKNHRAVREAADKIVDIVERRVGAGRRN